MKQSQIKQPSKKVSKHRLVRIHVDTLKKAERLLNSANKKEFGRKVRIDQLISMALDHVTDLDLRLLQEKSMTNIDRIEVLRRKYSEQKGDISKDEFAGFMLTAEFLSFAQGYNSEMQSVQIS
jgi:hypothetical protein